MTHDTVDHLNATHYLLTGQPPLPGKTRDEDWPHVGAVLAKELGAQSKVPPFVTVPEFVSPVGPARPGQHAGFLGPRRLKYTGPDEGASNPAGSPEAHL